MIFDIKQAKYSAFSGNSFGEFISKPLGKTINFLTQGGVKRWARKLRLCTLAQNQSDDKGSETKSVQHELTNFKLFVLVKKMTSMISVKCVT